MFITVAMILMEPMIDDRPNTCTEKMKKGGCATKKMAKGGGVEAKGKTKGTQVKMTVGKTGMVKKMAKGGGVETKGKTKGRMV